MDVHEVVGQRKAWLRFLCRKGWVKRSTHNEQFFVPLEKLCLVFRTLGGDWLATPKGIQRNRMESPVIERPSSLIQNHWLDRARCHVVGVHPS
jgi:hypothetical protein